MVIVIALRIIVPAELPWHIQALQVLFSIAQINCLPSEKFHQLLAVGRWFPPGTPVSSTRKLVSSSFHRLDMTLAVAEALDPNKPTKPAIRIFAYIFTFIAV